MARPIVLVGTGTSVGKTHVAERLLRALTSRGVRAWGYKPVESGVTPDATTDASRLAASSPFHVKHVPFRVVFEAPISPHLAARGDGVTIDVEAIRTEIRVLSGLVDALVVELPGGAFSPLTSDLLVAQFARSVTDARVLLVAPDRLGVLHDVGAAVRACAAIGLPLDGVVLNAPSIPDESTGRNAAELPLVTRVPLIAEIPHGRAETPVHPSDPALRLADAVTR